MAGCKDGETVYTLNLGSACSYEPQRKSKLKIKRSATTKNQETSSLKDAKSSHDTHNRGKLIIRVKRDKYYSRQTKARFG
jgi:hypothetical protein